MRDSCHHGNQNRATQKTVFHHFPNARHHLIAFALTNDTARQGVGGRGKGDARDDENHIGASDYRRNAYSGLAHLLNHDEKDEPSAKRKQALYHAREGHLENVAHQGRLPLVPAKHAIFLVRYLDVGINPEEEKRRDFSQQRGQSRTANAHLRQAHVAENQNPVEKDVDHGHDDGREGDDLGAANADIEGAEQEVEHHEHDAELPESQIFIGRQIDVFGFDDDMK